MNKILLVIFGFSVCFVEASTAEEEICPPVPKHYTELGCKPIISDGKKCPSRFECSEITDLDGKKCHYEGKTYKSAEELTNEDTSPLCAASCRCDDRSTPARFNCANIECPHHFMPYKPECKQVYKNKTCCPELICDKAEIEKLSTCHFEGTEYRLGEKMYPTEDSCFVCQCSENYDNSTVVGNQNCEEINCGIQLRSLAKIQSGCIPLYYGTSRCCPIGWKCPDEKEDEVIPLTRSGAQNPDSKLTCKFGKLTMNIGDELKTDDKCKVCTCTTPPMPTCVQKSEC